MVMLPVLVALLAATPASSPAVAPTSGEKINCGSLAELDIQLLHPNSGGEPRRLQGSGEAVEVVLQAYRSQVTRGEWLSIPAGSPVVIQEETGATIPLGKACSHPDGDPRLEISLKWGFLGMAVTGCRPAESDAIRISIVCK
jgi:hypothetical protein